MLRYVFQRYGDEKCLSCRHFSDCCPDMQRYPSEHEMTLCAASEYYETEEEVKHGLPGVD